MKLVIAVALLVAHTSLAWAGQVAAAQLSGVLRNTGGAPVADADVLLSGPTGDAVARTGDDGAYRFSIQAPGTYTVTARTSGFRAVPQTVILEANASVDVALVLQPSYSATVVGSVFRTDELILSAPAAVSVITSDDIAGSPADNLPDLLRLAPGLNITQFGARDTEINARGASGVLANSMLVMIDGRSFFQPFYGAVYWDLGTVTKDEIDHIEVMRTPASALWGANALNGVINFTTKSPRQMQGLRGYLGFGEVGTRTAGVTWAAAGERVSYKLSGSYYEQDAWARDNVLPDGSPMPAFVQFQNRGTVQPKFDARVDWGQDAQAVWSLRGGIAGANGLIHSALGPAEFGSGSYYHYVELMHHTDNLDVNIYWNRLDAPFRIVLFGLDESLVNDTYVADVSHQLRVGSHHRVILGGSARADRFDITIAPDAHRRVDLAAFGEDTFTVNRQITVVGGGRVDRFDSVGTVFAPRLGVVVQPWRAHTFRVTYNRAFRAPSLLENFVNVSLPAVAPVDPPFYYTQYSLGSTGLSMERQDATEIGYTGAIDPLHLTVFATVYTQRIANDIWFLPVDFYGPGAPPPGWPGDPATAPVLPKVFSFLNLAALRDRGVELAARMQWPQFSVQGSYTFADLPHVTTGTGATLQTNLPPRHQAGGTVTYATGPWTTTGGAHFTDRAFWADILNEPFWGYTDAYVSVDASASYRPRRAAWTLWVTGTDLLDHSIKTHVFGDTIRRKVTAGVRWQWEPDPLPRRP
jgi:outer membrane receptor protein involved in Fe transport